MYSVQNHGYRCLNLQLTFDSGKKRNSDRPQGAACLEPMRKLLLGLENDVTLTHRYPCVIHHACVGSESIVTIVSMEFCHGQTCLIKN